MAGPLSRRLCPSTSITINLCTCGPKSRRYEVIALTIHFGFRDLVTPKLGQGHWMSNLTFRLVCTWGKKMKALSQGVMKLSRLQAILVSVTWWPWNKVKVTECQTWPSEYVTFRLVSYIWGKKNEGPKSRRYEVIAHLHRPPASGDNYIPQLRGKNSCWKR